MVCIDFMRLTAPVIETGLWFVLPTSDDTTQGDELIYQMQSEATGVELQT